MRALSRRFFKKKGDVNDAGKYRGITLINVLAKIYSQLLLNRLSNWAKIHDKITNNQFVFQKGKSIVDCIFILHSVICKIQSALVISISKGLSEIHRDIRTSTYQISRIKKKNLTTKFICNLTP